MELEAMSSGAPNYASLRNRNFPSQLANQLFGFVEAPLVSNHFCLGPKAPILTIKIQQEVPNHRQVFTLTGEHKCDQQVLDSAVPWHRQTRPQSPDHPFATYPAAKYVTRRIPWLVSVRILPP